MQDENFLEKRVEQIEQAISSAEKSLEKAKSLVSLFKRDLHKDKYKDMEGIEGVYDGEFLITKEGKKLEVPANYAAKSRLVVGDKLKVIEDEGKSVFKQIDKVKRRKIEGILSKKEGKWFILSDTGSYRVSNNAIEFNNVVLGDEAIAYIPEENLSAPYAALDKVLKKTVKPGQPESKVESSANAPVAKVDNSKQAEVSVKKPAPAAPKQQSTAADKKAGPKKPDQKGSKKPINKKPMTGGKPYNPSTVVKEEISAITESPASTTPATSAAPIDDDDLR